MLKRKTGAGALARPVLVALGLRPDGKKDVIDFRLAQTDSATQWKQFLGDLVRRGLHGECLETLCVDGGTVALAMMKAMQAEGVEWGEDYRQGARDAVAELLRGRMDQLINQHLERIASARCVRCTT